MTDERDARDDEELRALRRETAPAPELEARVVRALHAEGLLAATARRVGPWLAAAAALAGFALGWSGREIARREAAPASAQLYLLLLSPLPEPADAPEEELVTEYRAWAGALQRDQRLVRGEKLGPDARVLDPAGGASQDAATGVSGFFLVRADSLDAATALARGCPHLRHGGRVTIRPIDPT